MLVKSTQAVVNVMSNCPAVTVEWILKYMSTSQFSNTWKPCNSQLSGNVVNLNILMKRCFLLNLNGFFISWQILSNFLFSSILLLELRDNNSEADRPRQPAYQQVNVKHDFRAEIKRRQNIHYICGKTHTKRLQNLCLKAANLCKKLVLPVKFFCTLSHRFSVSAC